MGDQQRGALLQETSNRFLNLVLGSAVYCAGRIIQDENSWIGEQVPCNGDALAWSTSEGEATLTNSGLVAIRNSGNKSVCLSILRCLFYSRLVCLSSQAIGDVISDGSREKEDILLDS